MRVTLNFNDNYRQNFGMALEMKSKDKFAQKIGSYPARQLDFARPSLESLASDVNIKVSPVSCRKNPRKAGVKIQISKVIENPVKRFFYFGYKPSATVRLCDVGFVANFPDCVLRQTRILKSVYRNMR